MPAYKRILLKLSGEALMGDDAFGINRATIVRMVEEIAEITRLGVQVAVVIGGGNIFRGVAGGSVGMDRATADYMGMLATVMNSLAVQSMLEAMDVQTRVQSAIKMDNVAEPFVRRRAMRHPLRSARQAPPPSCCRPCRRRRQQLPRQAPSTPLPCSLRLLSLT